MKTLSIATSFLAICLLFLGCQLEKTDPEAPVNTFEKTFNTGFNSNWASMCAQLDGNIRIVSNEYTGLGGDFDPVVFKVDPEGNVIWKKNITPYVNLGAIRPSDAGDYEISFSQSTLQQLGLLEMAEDGTVVKEHKSDPFPFMWAIGNSFQTSLAKPKAHQTLVCGNTEGNDSLHVLSIYRENSVEVTSVKAEISDCFGVCIINTQDGVLVCGSGTSGLRLVKFKSDVPDITDLQEVWNKNNYGLSNAIYWAAQTSDGGFFVCGSQGAFLKTDASGTKQWSTTPTGQSASLYFVLETQDGNYLACGSKDGKSYAAKVAVDDTGLIVLWENTYEKGTQFNQAIETDDNGFLMVGAIGSIGNGNGIHLVKTDQLGNVY